MADSSTMPTELQNAIFQFAMTLITQYRRSMGPVEAALKCADWLESLALKIRDLAPEYTNTIDDTMNKFKAETKEESS